MFSLDKTEQRAAGLLVDTKGELLTHECPICKHAAHVGEVRNVEQLDVFLDICKGELLNLDAACVSVQLTLGKCGAWMRRYDFGLLRRSTMMGILIGQTDRAYRSGIAT